MTTEVTAVGANLRSEAVRGAGTCIICICGIAVAGMRNGWTAGTRIGSSGRRRLLCSASAFNTGSGFLFLGTDFDASLVVERDFGGRPRFGRGSFGGSMGELCPIGSSDSLEELSTLAESSSESDEVRSISILAEPDELPVVQVFVHPDGDESS